jgi:hypothetical protein
MAYFQQRVAANSNRSYLIYHSGVVVVSGRTKLDLAIPQYFQCLTQRAWVFDKSTKSVT